MNSVQLRTPVPADVPALARLGRESFVAKFGTLYSPEDLATFLETTHSEGVVAAEIAAPGRAYRLAELDGKLVGYGKLSLACGWPEHARGRNAIEIKQLYTAPDMAGKGIGAALMDWMMAEARAFRADEIQLSVWSENFGAQRFYARYGFEKIADIQFRVGEQLDEEFLYSLLI